jgi:hypothetical protein
LHPELYDEWSSGFLFVFAFLRRRSLTQHFVRVRGLFLMPLLGASQEVAEEGRPDVPSGASFGARKNCRR